MRKQVLLRISLLMAALMSCHPTSVTEIGAEPDADLVSTPRPGVQPAQPVGVRNGASVSLPTAEPTRSFMPSPTPTPQLAVNPPGMEWRMAGPGILEIPILLYHHVDPGRTAGKLSVTPEQFESQIRVLAEAGFQTITSADLRQAILHGAPLPARPLIITFDDGHSNNHVYAYPILEGYGFDAVIYVVANRLWSSGFLSGAQLIELSEAGWEVGSHSMTHADLTTLGGRELRLEIFGSREQLEANLGLEVTSFAYPFGAFSPEVADLVRAAGYRTAMGLGKSIVQGSGNLYYLSRIPVDGLWTVAEFAAAVGIGPRP